MAPVPTGEDSRAPTTPEISAPLEPRLKADRAWILREVQNRRFGTHTGTFRGDDSSRLFCEIRPAQVQAAARPPDKSADGIGTRGMWDRTLPVRIVGETAGIIGPVCRVWLWPVQHPGGALV